MDATTATAADVAAYLRTHKTPPAALEFLTADSERHMFYIRWPNGSHRWESAASLKARGLTIPARTLLGGTESV